MLVVTIGEGVGLGIAIHGEIYRGALGGAGEFGHTKVRSNLLCECGAVGCLEAVVSEEGIISQVAALGRTVDSVDRAMKLPPLVMGRFAKYSRTQARYWARASACC